MPEDRATIVVFSGDLDKVLAAVRPELGVINLPSCDSNRRWIPGVDISTP